MRIHEKIKQALLETPGLTQKGLAEKMGLNPAAVNRMLHGRRNIMAQEIPIIEGYLGIPLLTPSDLEYPQDNAPVPRGLAEPVRPDFTGAGALSVPVYGIDPGAGLLRDQPVDQVPAHPSQIGSRDAFACYIPATDMVPRYFKGELIYLHPGRPVHTGQDCMIELGNGTVVLRHLVTETETGLHVKQFQPLRDYEIDKQDILRISAVVGRG